MIQGSFWGGRLRVALGLGALFGRGQSPTLTRRGARRFGAAEWS